MTSLSSNLHERVCDLDEHAEVWNVSRGRILCRQGHRVEKVYCLKRGRFQLYRVISSGKRLDLATIEPGAFFGQLSILDTPPSDVTAEATEDSLVWAMDPAVVRQLLRTCPEMAVQIMEALSRRLALVEVRIEEMAYRSVPARVAAVLLRLSDGRPDATISITHQELGDMVGALRETVTKVLAEFRAGGLVELGRGCITMRDASALKARLDE